VPALVLLEPVMLVIAAAQGWLPAKVGAIAGVVRALPATLRERRDVQRSAAIAPAEFAAPLQSDLDSPLFGSVGRSRIVRALLRLYWAGVRRGLGRTSTMESG